MIKTNAHSSHDLLRVVFVSFLLQFSLSQSAGCCDSGYLAPCPILSLPSVGPRTAPTCLPPSPFKGVSYVPIASPSSVRSECSSCAPFPCGPSCCVVPSPGCPSPFSTQVCVNPTIVGPSISVSIQSVPTCVSSYFIKEHTINLCFCN
jgi:hypothetical protein